jgi:hypothetical protein
MREQPLAQEVLRSYPLYTASRTFLVHPLKNRSYLSYSMLGLVLEPLPAVGSAGVNDADCTTAVGVANNQQVPECRLPEDYVAVLFLRMIWVEYGK